MKQTYNTIIDAIGKTPLIKVPFNGMNTYIKLEYLNPGGSIKDRSALYMIQSAEKQGIIKPGGTIIEASSGNQGIATAMIASSLGYKAVITVSEKVSQEKKDTMLAYGATLIVCKPTSRIDDPEGYHACAMRIHKNTPNSFMLNQYFNIENRNAHERGIAEEIWEQTEGKVTHIFAAAGSCGTVSGIGRCLKNKNSNIQIYGVDSACSYRATNGQPEPYAIEGMGVDYNTPLYENTALNGFVNVSDENAMSMVKKLARVYGILAGPATGAVAHAVYEYSKKLKSSDVVIFLCTDSGRAYLSKGYYLNSNDHMIKSENYPAAALHTNPIEKPSPTRAEMP